MVLPAACSAARAVCEAPGASNLVRPDRPHVLRGACTASPPNYMRRTPPSQHAGTPHPPPHTTISPAIDLLFAPRALIGIIAPMAIIILVLLGVVAFQLNKRHQARKSKLLKEVTTTSQTVMSDLNKKKSTNGPTVVVDGKAMDPVRARPR
eukprot:3505921-Pleurochrysis_carterae.AAC.1